MKGEMFIHSIPNQGTEISFQCCFCSPSLSPSSSSSNKIFNHQEKLNSISSEISKFIKNKYVLLISSFASRNVLQSILKFYHLNIFSFSSIEHFYSSDFYNSRNND